MWPIDVALPALRDLPRLPHPPVVGELHDSRMAMLETEEIELRPGSEHLRLRSLMTPDLDPPIKNFSSPHAALHCCTRLAINF